jgi:hypothetical protein
MPMKRQFTTYYFSKILSGGFCGGTGTYTIFGSKYDILLKTIIIIISAKNDA